MELDLSRRIAGFPAFFELHVQIARFFLFLIVLIQSVLMGRTHSVESRGRVLLKDVIFLELEARLSFQH